MEQEETTTELLNWESFRLFKSKLLNLIWDRQEALKIEYVNQNNKQIINMAQFEEIKENLEKLKTYNDNLRKLEVAVGDVQ